MVESAVRHMRAQVTARSMRPIVISAINRHKAGAILHENGGPFKCSPSFLHRLARKMGLSRRAATTAAQKEPDNVEEVAKLWHHKLAFRD